MFSEVGKIRYLEKISIVLNFLLDAFLGEDTVLRNNVTNLLFMCFQRERTSREGGGGGVRNVRRAAGAARKMEKRTTYV